MRRHDEVKMIEQRVDHAHAGHLGGGPSDHGTVKSRPFGAESGILCFPDLLGSRRTHHLTDLTPKVNPKGKRGRLISLPLVTIEALKEHRAWQEQQK